VEKYWKRWVVNGEEDSKASLLAVALNVQAGGVLVVVDSVSKKKCALRLICVCPFCFHFVVFNLFLVLWSCLFLGCVVAF